MKRWKVKSEITTPVSVYCVVDADTAEQAIEKALDCATFGSIRKCAAESKYPTYERERNTWMIEELDGLVSKECPSVCSAEEDNYE